jgi:hypothetical protein
MEKKNLAGKGLFSHQIRPRIIGMPGDCSRRKAGKKGKRSQPALHIIRTAPNRDPFGNTRNGVSHREHRGF